MVFLSSYCMDNLQYLAGYRVSMDRENNRDKKTLAEQN